MAAWTPTPLTLEQQQENRGPQLLIVTTVVYSIAMVLAATRFVIRYKSKRFAVDDILLLLGILFLTVATGLLIASVKEGFGRHAQTIDLVPSQNIALYCILQFIFYAWSINFIRLSFLYSILYFALDSNTKRVKIALYTLIGVQTLLPLFLTLVECFRCKPIQAAWTWSYPRDACLDQMTYVKITYGVTSISFAFNLLNAFLTIPFIVRLRLSWSDRLVLLCLVTLMLFASMANIPKIISLSQLWSTFDLTYEMVQFIEYNSLECSCTILAVSLPALRNVVQKLLARFDLLPKGSALRFETIQTMKRSPTLSTAPMTTHMAQPPELDLENAH